MRVLAFLFVILLESVSSPAFAWWDEGHMQIAYLVYQRLDPAVKDRADVLLRLNPDHQTWTSNAPERKEKLYAFVHAATWADETKADYYADEVTGSTAGQIVPYGHLKHGYWHFKDILYSPDGTTLPAPAAPDAVTRLKLMNAKLPACQEHQIICVPMI
ncbi:hypothetical protein J2R76_004008 [Bradyrhizobium sp. USDA 4532]|uniref:S1/P1 nuclease n=1 Tax=unclassified Bradyrhizobium TaxID=2631580 RepID=UPI00209CCF9A|nr:MULTISPECIES: S1/P1 nuclease [unclassified Bradyrhizobium]MCP1835668.1 hypothetical protein [Bradyrhizobium sp. USDA 4545]MCP1920417.1 hypothetical protein [Bradyrhizobium sp. USDA 4532]